MAHPVERNGAYRIQFSFAGQKYSATYDTPEECYEYQDRIKNAEPEPPKVMTVRDFFTLYADEYSAKKRGEQWERIRLTALARYPLFENPLTEVTTPDLVAWRNNRKKEGVSNDTVNREMTLLSHVFEMARKEKHLIQINPMRDVGRLKSNPHRERRITDHEIELVTVSGGFVEDFVTSKDQECTVAFLFAIETAMRSGEILNMERKHVTGNVVSIPRTKNDAPRQVPLSPRAKELLTFLPVRGPKYFSMSDKQRDGIWRKILKRTPIDDLHFHDSRHEATYRLAKIYHVLDLARITGHKNINELMTYYHKSAEEMAEALHKRE